MAVATSACELLAVSVPPMGKLEDGNFEPGAAALIERTFEAGRNT
jgi:hypothetical protein